MSNICKNIKDMITAILVQGIILAFSLSVDGTKYPKSININTAYKCIMGQAHPNHLINTANLSKREINTILNTKYGDLALEIKIVTICFQNAEKGKTPITIFTARPQGINKVLLFTSDTCKAACIAAKEFKNVTFSNFTTDRVLVETRDIMSTLLKFLDGKSEYAAAVDKKHNVKTIAINTWKGPMLLQ